MRTRTLSAADSCTALARFEYRDEQGRTNNAGSLTLAQEVQHTRSNAGVALAATAVR